LVLCCLQLGQLLLLPVPLLPLHIFHLERVRPHRCMLLMLQVRADTSCCRTWRPARVLLLPPLLYSAPNRPRFCSAAAAWRACCGLLHAACVQQLWLGCWCCHVNC
jgi:hypothetical protein